MVYKLSFVPSVGPQEVPGGGPSRLWVPSRCGLRRCLHGVGSPRRRHERLDEIEEAYLRGTSETEEDHFEHKRRKDKKKVWRRLRVRERELSRLTGRTVSTRREQDDDYYLEIERHGRACEFGAPRFVQQLYALLGRPFEAEKSIPVALRCQHLGFVNVFTRWQSHSAASLTPRDGKVEEFLDRLTKVCRDMEVSLDEMHSLTGGLFFLSSFRYRRASRGGYRAMCDFLATPGPWHTGALIYFFGFSWFHASWYRNSNSTCRSKRDT